jgi:hypothetical protein
MRVMLAIFLRHTRAALRTPPIPLDEFDAGGIRGGFQRRFTRCRDDWVRFAKKSPLTLSASALQAFEGVRLVHHRSRR